MTQIQVEQIELFIPFPPTNLPGSSPGLNILVNINTRNVFRKVSCWKNRFGNDRHRHLQELESTMDQGNKNFFLEKQYYGLNVCVPPKSICWNPHAQCNGNFGSWLGHEVGALMNKNNALTKESQSRSQDGGVGRRRVNISPELGHLLATGGGPWRPRRWEEPPSEPVGRGETGRRGEVEARQDWRPWGQGDQEGRTGGNLQEERERSRGWSPGPLVPGSLLSSQAGTPPPKPPPGRVGPGCIKGRLGISGEAGRRGPARPEEQERRGGRLPHPLELRKPAGLPGEVPCPLRLGVGGTPGPFLFLEPKPHPLQPTGSFLDLWVLSIDLTHCPNFALD